MATRKTSVDVERGELKFKLNMNEVELNFCRSMKKSNDMNGVSIIEGVGDKYMRVPIERRMAVEALVTVLMNFDADFWCDYLETVNA